MTTRLTQAIQRMETNQRRHDVERIRALAIRADERGDRALGRHLWDALNLEEDQLDAQADARSEEEESGDRINAIMARRSAAKRALFGAQ